MVREAAAHRLEELVTHTQGVDHVGEFRDRDPRDLGEFLDVGPEIGGRFDGHRLVGAPRREHLHRKAVLTHLDVVFERVDRVVRRADHLDVVVPHQAARMVFGLLQEGRTAVVDLARRRGVQELRHPEGGFQFQVRPVVERVAHRIGNRLGPLLELLPVGRILARAVTLLDTVRAHGTPLVVVAFEPDLRQVLEAVVRSHVLRDQMAMIVDDRLFGRVFVIKPLRRFGLQQKILVVELFHLVYRSIPVDIPCVEGGPHMARPPFQHVKLATFRDTHYEKSPN